MNTSKHLSLLGLRVQDKVTRFTGVVTSICFDLYGCVQALVHPGMDAQGKIEEQIWFDVTRLEIMNKKPVMAPPNYDIGPQAEGKQGSAEKPKPTIA